MQGDSKMYIVNFFKHLHTVNKHRFYVFKLCLKAGIPIRGLLHDLSKYSPVEFFEGVKYFNGKRSPIPACIKEKGYSKAWLHHKGKNKHHFEYWVDFSQEEKGPVIPYKYAVEMVCDTLAAGLVYNGKEWTKESQLNYYNRRKDKEYINPKIQKFLVTVYEEVAANGIDKTITSKNLKKIYNESII